MHIFGVSLGISAFHFETYLLSTSAHVLHFAPMSLVAAVAWPWKSTATCLGCQSFHCKNHFLNRITVNNLLHYSDGYNKDA